MKRLVVGIIALLSAASAHAFPIIGYVQLTTGAVQAGGFNTQTGTVGTLTATNGTVATLNSTSLNATVATAGTVIDSGLPSGQCVQTTTNGQLTTTGAQCGAGGGGGGGASTLEVLAGVVRTSPTVTVGFPATQFSGAVTGSSVTVTLNASSVTLQGNTNVFLLNSTQTVTGATIFSSVTVLGPLIVGTTVYSTNFSGLATNSRLWQFQDNNGFVTQNALTINDGGISGTIMTFGGASNTQTNIQSCDGVSDNTGTNTGNVGDSIFLGQGPGGGATSGVGMIINPLRKYDLSVGPSVNPPYDFYISTQQYFSFIGSGTVRGAGGLGVTYNVNAGSITGSGLSTCGDATHALAWSGGTFSCQSITGSGSGGSLIYAATSTASFPFGFTYSTMSSTAFNTTTTSATVTGSGGLAIVGPGAGVWLGGEGVPPAGMASGTDMLWADSSSHTWVFNQNNVSTFTVVGSSTNAIPGHLAAWGSQFGLLDGGVALATQTVTVTISSGSGFNGLSIPVWRAPTNTAVTVVKILAESLGAGTTVLYQLDARPFGTINSAGTSTFSVSFSTANNTGVSTTSFANTAIAAQSSLVLTTPALGASAGSPTAMTFTLYYNRNTQ